jgi:hypothetical protein
MNEQLIERFTEALPHLPEAQRERHHLLAMKVVEAAWMFRTCAPHYRVENESELIEALWELRNFEADIGLR